MGKREAVYPELRPETPLVGEAQAGVLVEGFECPGELVDEPFECLGEQLVHRPEVVVHEPVLDARLLGDGPGGDAGVSNVIEQPLGRIHQLNRHLLALLGDWLLLPGPCHQNVLRLA